MSSGVAYVAGSVAALSFAREHDPHSATTNRSHHAAGNEKAAASPGGQRKGRAAAEPTSRACAEKVLRSFNTWAFKREQPSNPQLMLRFITEAIAAQEPLQFVLYWGKGPRHEVGLPEIQCLDFLDAMTSRVRAVYTLGAALTLILTDTHAELNG